MLMVSLLQLPGENFYLYFIRLQEYINDVYSWGYQASIREVLLCIFDGMTPETRSLAERLSDGGLLDMGLSEMWEFFCYMDNHCAQNESLSPVSQIVETSVAPLEVIVENHIEKIEEEDTPSDEIIPSSPIDESDLEPTAEATEQVKVVSCTREDIGGYEDPFDSYFDKPPIELNWWYYIPSVGSQAQAYDNSKQLLHSLLFRFNLFVCSACLFGSCAQEFDRLLRALTMSD